MEFETEGWARWSAWRREMVLPLIVAPMTAVSGPELAAASCAAGVIGSFPTHNVPTAYELQRWISQFERHVRELRTPETTPAPLAVNLMLRRSADRVAADLDCIMRQGVPIVIASVGSPKAIVPPLHEAGAVVLADVATLRHARSALAAGVDGLVLLTAGAGGQTGWMNGMCFARAVRDEYHGPIVMAGGIYDGQALWAAEVLGCDAGYMGTAFIAAAESLAEQPYREAVRVSSMDDVSLTVQASGISANLLAADPARPPAVHGYSAGHTVSSVDDVLSVHDLVAKTAAQYHVARERTAAMLQRKPGLTR